MIKRRNIPLGKDVYCTNGLAGRSSHLILNPLNRRITHLVVRKRHFPHSDRVVPMELVADTTRALIRLSCSTRELTLLEPFTETHFVAVDPLELNYPYDPLLLWPYVTPEEELLPIDEERVPPGELAVGRSARVQDIGGGYMGSVDEFLVDSADECITRLVAREGHPGNQKEVTIPISKLHGWRRKQCISNWTDGDLPSCPTRPIRRHWWS